MKKIVFLILFLTGLFPVFNDNGMCLGSYNSYGQGELDEVEIHQCTGVTTTITYETDEYIDYEDCEEEYDYDLETCVATTDCIIRTEYKEPEDEDPCAQETYNEIACNEKNCGTTCQPGYTMTDLCNCEQDVQPCYNSCGEGYYQTLDCGCEPIPTCPTSCSSGYVLVNCNCVPCPSSCPTGYTLVNCTCKFTPPPIPEPCDQKASAAGLAAKNVLNDTDVQNSLTNFPAFLPQGSNQNESLFTINNNNGSIEVTATQSGTSTNSNSVSGYSAMTIADAHTHPADGYAVPSAQDIFALDNKRDQISNFTTSYIKAHDGNLYALYIEDATKFNTFINNNAGFVDTDNHFKLGTPLGNRFWDTVNDLVNNGYSDEEAHTRATAFVLQESGVILLKSDATTINFKKIDLKVDIPAIGPNGITIYSNIDCN